ncbi:MAG: protein kinase [Acidobacteriales bacterium]|nr:protein kinase [Terriglobales bacterium]
MALDSGTKLGPYEILAPIGAGGMGEVYKARDTRLEREVAIKVLPGQSSASVELRTRFEREARAISSFQHPNICTLHDVGHQDNTDYLVMELLDGESLAKRLERGPIPLDQLLKIAFEIAGALDKAHHNGIVHRDLKPGNIMLTKGGAKLMDFGLAKPSSVALAGSGTLPVFSAALTMDSLHSPITQQGTIIGTIQYMSPEQLQGKDADARSDIFAFGAVLYEMATGKRAFEGKSQLSVASAILEKDPEPISISQPLTPQGLEQVVRTCLAKDPEDRFQTAHDLRLQLGWIESGGMRASVPASGGYSTRRMAAWIVAAAIAAAALTAAAIALFRETPRPEVVRSNLLPPEKSAFQSMDVVFSPDGRTLAFVAAGESGSGIWVRQMNASAAKLLSGTEGASAPFWSPDGKSLGFFGDSKLKKVDVVSGAVMTICEAPDARGGSWSADGVIIFTPTTDDALYRVSADGGTPSPLTQLDSASKDQTHRWPQFLPDGRYIYLSRAVIAKNETTGIYIAALGSKERVQLVKTEFRGMYVAGYLLFMQNRSLFAQKLDLKRSRLAGSPVLLAENVLSDNRWTAAYAASATMLAFHSGAEGSNQLVWFDRTGKVLEGKGATQVGVFRLSPDGSKVAVSATDRGNSIDLWILDLALDTKTRFTFLDNAEDDPQWSPDGKTIVYDSTVLGQYDIYSKPADGSEKETLLWKSTSVKYSTSVSRDGKFLAFDNTDPTNENRTDVFVLPLTGDHKAFPFQATKAVEQFGDFSPDGKWMAFTSNEAGRHEIYVAPFPGGQTKYQVSQGGGMFPRWRRDGKELYYVSLDLFITAVDVDSTDRSFSAGNAKKLFRIRPSRPAYAFDVAADGKRFLVNQLAGANVNPMSLVLNWTQELEKE